MQQQSGNMLTTQEKTFSLAPQNLDEALRFAEILATSSIVPKEFIGNAGNILVAIQWGMELGLQPMQAMQSIAVINGRPSLWGDAVIALVRSSALCEYVYETDDGETATCRVKRRGEDEEVRTFSVADAAAAGLKGKSGPWTQYPKRMRQMRARSFAMRDVFPDVLRGMPVAEEIQDYPIKEKDMGPVVTAERKQAEEITTYPQADFEKNFPAWSKVIELGKKSADEVIATVEAKAPLTEEQRKQILAVVAPIEVQAEGDQH